MPLSSTKYTVVSWVPRYLALFLTFLLISSINLSLLASKHDNATNSKSLVRIRVRVNGKTYIYYVRRSPNNEKNGAIVFKFRGAVQEPSFHRENGVWPVILNGSQLPDLVGLSYGNIRVLYYNGTSQEWVEVPYQIDERGYSYEIVDYDDTPTYDWVFTYIRWGAQELGPGGTTDPNQMQKKFDNDDELVFYAYNGSRVDESTWWNTSYPYRIELTIIDPVDNGQCWMYIYFRNDTTIITDNPYEDTELDFIDWFPSNLTAKSQYYSTSLNSSNPDLTSFMKPMGGDDMIKEGNKQWLCVNGTISGAGFSKDCNREGTWDAYYTEIKSNVGFLNGNDIRQEGVGNGSAISDGPVRVIVNISHYIEVSISAGFVTVTETEVKRDILFFYSRFRGSPYKVRIEDNPDIENEMVKYVFAGILSFSSQAFGTQIYYGNYTQGGYYGVDIVSGTGTDDYHTSGGDPWTPNLDPIRNNDDIPEWIIFNNSDMVEFLFPPYRLLLQVKENASGVYTYWKDEATISEFGPVIEALAIPVNTITVFVADLIVKLQPATSDSEVNNTGQKFFQYFNHTEISLVEEETMISDISFLEFQYQVQSAPQDTTPPNVTIDEPANNSVVGGIVTIQVTSSDENPDTTWLTIDGNTVATWGGAGTFTYDWDTTSYSDGEHQIVAYANDTAGNVGSYNITVIVDNTSPSVTIDQPQNGSYVKGTVTIQVTSSDPHPNTTWLEIDGNTVDSWSGSGTFTYNWDTMTIGDGTHQIVAYANDSVGNMASYSIIVTVDNTPPTVSIDSPQNNCLVSGTVNIQVNSSDQNPNTTWLVINDSVVATWDGAGTFTYNWDTASYSDGVYEIIAYANDSAGNLESYKIYVEVDNTAPSVTIDSPANNSVVSGTVNVVVTSNDPHDNTTWLTINGTVVQTWGGDGTFTYSWDTTTYENDYYELIAYANDTLGNLGSYRIIVQVSNEGLAVSITNPQNNSVVGGVVDIEVSSSNAEMTWLEIDENAVQYWSGSGTFTYSWNTSTESETQHEIIAYANDTEGNIASYRILVTVDNTPPSVTISQPANQSLVKGAVTITLSSSDPHADNTWLGIDGDVVWTWNGGGTFSYNWDTTKVSDGDHEVIAYANDTAGNIGSYEIMVTVDNTAPQVSISQPANNSVVNGTVVIQLSSSDVHSDTTWLVIDSAQVRSWSGDGDFTYSWDTTSESDGLHEIIAYANDTLGNQANYRIVVTVDNTPPSVSISEPTNNSVVGGTISIVVVSDDANPNTTWLSIDGTIVKYWSGDGTFTYSWDTTSVSDGSHKIVAYANDTVGHQASYSITVAVDNTPPDVSISSPQNNSVVHSTITIELSSSDLHPNKTWLTIDGDVVKSWSGDGDFTYDWDTTTTSDGQHSIVAHANDTAGNMGSYDIVVTVDNTPPSVTITSPSNDSTVGTTFDVTWDASDDTTDVEKVEVYLNGTLDAVYVKGSNMTNTHTFSGLEPDQDYIVNITVYDSAGWSSYDWILVHTSGFFISITSPNDGDAFNTSWVLVEWEYGELDTVEIYLNGSLVDVVPADTRSYNITNLNEGAWNITLVGLNTSTIPPRQTSDMVIIYIDWTPPYVNILRPTDGELLNTSDVYVEWEGDDQPDNVTTGIDHYEIKWDKSSWIDVGKSTSYTVTLSDGDHTIYVKAVDRAGNIAIDQVTITVDTTPPSVNIESPDNGSYICSSKIAVSWSAYDANGVDHYEVSVDGGSRMNVGQRLNYMIRGLSEGMHNITVYAVDVAGNVGSSTVVVYVDLTKPSITLNVPSVVITNSTTITVEWSGSDNFDVDHYEVSVDYTSWIDIGNSTSYTATLSAGEHVVCVRVYDVAGLYSQTFMYVYVDVLAPTIDIGSPSNNSYINTHNVSIHWMVQDDFAYSECMLSINNGEWISVGGKTSCLLSNLSDGEYIIKIRAIDYAGNIEEVILKFIIDTASPSIQIISPEDCSCITTSDINVEWSGYDENSVSYYLVRLSSGSWINVGTSTSHTFSGVADGTYVIYVIAVDHAGNKAMDSIVVTVKQNKAGNQDLGDEWRIRNLRQNRMISASNLIPKQWKVLRNNVSESYASPYQAKSNVEPNITGYKINTTKAWRNRDPMLEAIANGESKLLLESQPLELHLREFPMMCYRASMNIGYQITEILIQKQRYYFKKYDLGHLYMN